MTTFEEDLNGAAKLLMEASDHLDRAMELLPQGDVFLSLSATRKDIALQLHALDRLEAKAAKLASQAKGNRIMVTGDGTLRCECGNTPCRDGFAPCDEHGNVDESLIDADSTGDLHYLCDGCGAVSDLIVL